MPDAPSVSASKSPIKDLPPGKQERRTAASPDIKSDETNTPGVSSATAQAASDRPDLIAEQVAASTARVAEHVAEAVQQVGTKATGDALHNALLLATRNVETAISTTNVAIRGAEEVTQTAVEYGQRNLEQMSTLVRSLWEVRSVADLVALHREHTRTAVEDMLEETTRLSMHLTKTFGEIVDTVTKTQPDFISAVRKAA